MLPVRAAVCLILSSGLSACGTYVPAIQENGADAVSGQQLVQSIVYNVTCEVQDAVDAIYNNPDHPRKSTFLDSWGAQIALNLQVEEKSSINPTVTWIPHSPASAIFSLFGGVSVSADATRQDKLNSYYTIKQIRRLGHCLKGTRPGGVLLLQSDLGLADWLRDNVTAADTGVIQFATDYSDGPLKTSVISHEIKFDITNTENITPGLKLSRVTLNGSGNFLSTTRDRTNDLTITLGPTVPTPKPQVDETGQQVRDYRGNPVVGVTYVPSRPAADAALSSQIGLAVSNALKGVMSSQ